MHIFNTFDLQQYQSMLNNQFPQKEPSLSEISPSKQIQIANYDQQPILFPPYNIQVNINGDILFMDKIIQSRINRSLVIHGLENLVFQKRQRKSIEPNPIPITKNIHQPKISKKKQATPKKQSTQIKTVQKNGKKSIQLPAKNIKTNNSIMKKKQLRKKQRQQDEEMIEQVQQKSINKAKQQFKANKKHTSIQKKKDNEIEAMNTKKESAQLINNNFNEKQMNKRGRGRPKKDVSKQINMDQQQPLELKQNLVLQIPPLILPQQEIVRNEMSIEQPSQQNESQQKVNNRQRKAKMNPYKSYNQNEENHFSQEQQGDQKEYKKKKKICKTYRNKNSNKPYSLNRIFRKEAKRHFQTFTLDLNLNKASLPYFIQQFGVFDLIHFSLPISYLYQFPEVGSMIQKGFIFVWAQQGQTQIGYHLLNRWGFDVIDQIVWIKSNEDENKIQADNVDICNSIDTNEDNQKQRQLFVNCKSTCLVGYKCPLGNKAEYRTKVSNNIIFAKTLDGIKKPTQIYEIADLMMPGAKKLQFGGHAQKGWLNLQHHQKTLMRCNNCLRQQTLFLLTNEQQKLIQCKRCIINNLKADSEGSSVQQITKLYKQLPKLKISEVNFVQQSLNCKICKISSSQFSYQGLIQLEDKQSLCLNCFKEKMIDKKLEKVKVIVEKKKIYLKNQITCSQCGVLSICDTYFECSKCKSHIVCKGCFWKNKMQNQLNVNDNGQEQQVKKYSKKETMHEWKLKFIKNSPLMKFACFGCHRDLSIPFWCCQTCQNWFWCGKCNKGSSDIHPHYQSNNHVEYIMI